MAYVKVKKIWKKFLKEEEIDQLWDICIEQLPPQIRENVEDTPYFDILMNSKTVHPETDIADGTAGVTPKQVRFLIDSVGFENIKKIFSILNSNIQSKIQKQAELNLDREEYNTNMVMWKFVFKDEIIPIIQNNKKSVALGKMFLENDLPVNIINKYKFDDEVYKAYLKNELSKDEFLEMNKRGLISNANPLTIKDVQMKSFWEDREEIWKKTHNFIPKLKGMLLIEPEYWDKKIFLDMLFYFFGTRQLAELDAEMQEKFIYVYKVFGKNIVVVANILKEKKIFDNNTLQELRKLPELYTFSEGILAAFEKIIQISKRGFYFNFDLTELATILATISLENGLSDFILKKDRITYAEFEEFVLSQKNSVLQYTAEGRISDLSAYDFKTFALFRKYNVRKETHKFILDLHMKTSAIKTTLPLFKESIGKYVVELVDKSDIRGLIAGDATNCCQRVTQAYRPNSYGGCASVYYGAEEKDSSFLLISKDDRIIAQSWVWLHKGVLCFDSLESLGGEPSDGIFECYEAYANYAIENCDDVEVVTMGAIHGGNSNVRKYKRVENPVIHKFTYDARNTQYEIARRVKTKKSKKEKTNKYDSFEDVIKDHNLKVIDTSYGTDLELPYDFDLLYDIKSLGQLKEVIYKGDGIHSFKDIKETCDSYLINQDVFDKYFYSSEDDDYEEDFEDEEEYEDEEN